MKDEMTGPAVVENIIYGSPAQRAGVEPGDRIVAIDGSLMRDAIDFSILMESDVAHDLEVERSGKTINIQIEVHGEEYGIDLENPVFGHLMLCDNDCVFCFVDQLPPGLRETLYVKDDDFRLSFLEGNFITLTNLGGNDIERIIEDRLSPLYVSLHAFDSDLRERIFNNPRAAKTLGALKSILDGKIEVHIQIVLMNGLNDGMRLDETVNGLFEMGPGIASIGIVPVGTTSVGRKSLPGEYSFDRGSSLHLIEQVEQLRDERYHNGVYLADEFYFLAGEAPPEATYYDDYPQAENGIGLARLFIDGFKQEMCCSGVILNPEGKGIITSPMGAWVLDQVSVDDCYIQREICRNSLFGDRVTVCGLLPGRDIKGCLERTCGVGTVLIPGIALAGGLFIDGISLEDVALGSAQNLCPIGGRGADLVQALSFVEWGE